LILPAIGSGILKIDPAYPTAEPRIRHHRPGYQGGGTMAVQFFISKDALLEWEHDGTPITEQQAMIIAVAGLFRGFKNIGEGLDAISKSINEVVVEMKFSNDQG
jgi:hypothetical protein